MYLYCACRLYRKRQEGNRKRQEGKGDPEGSAFKVAPLKDWKSNKMTPNSCIDEVRESDTGSDLFERTDAARAVLSDTIETKREGVYYNI